MRATDPVVTFVLVLVIGVVAGILFDRLAAPSWFHAGTRPSGSLASIIGGAICGDLNAHDIDRFSELFVDTYVNHKKKSHGTGAASTKQGTVAGATTSLMTCVGQCPLVALNGLSAH